MENEYDSVSSLKERDMSRQVLSIDLPISAQELELRLHSFCDHHGWDYRVVGSEYAKNQSGEYAMRLLMEPTDNVREWL